MKATFEKAPVPQHRNRAEPGSLDERYARQLAEAILLWLAQGDRLHPDDDLCVVRAVPGLVGDAVPASIEAEGRVWRCVRVSCDLELRWILSRSEGASILAFTTCDSTAFQADLIERAVLHRVIEPLARHLFSALVGLSIPVGLNDEHFSEPLRIVLARAPQRLLAAARKRSWTAGVREGDAAAIICEAAFGFDERASRLDAAALWADLIMTPAISEAPSLVALAREVFERRFAAHAAILEAILVDGPGFALQFAAEASFSTPPKGAPRLKEITADPRAKDRILELAYAAALEVGQRDPVRLETLLAPVDAAYVAAGSPSAVPNAVADGEWTGAAARVGWSPLIVRQAYLISARAFVLAANSQQSPDESQVDALSSSAFAVPAYRDALRLLTRLGRGLACAEAIELPSDLKSFVDQFANEIAWLDLTARRVRGNDSHGDETFENVRRALVGRWYALRDRWNEAFAKLLLNVWPTLFRSPGEFGPLVLPQLLSNLIRPLVEKGPTFLVVLDGCDLATFYELVGSLSARGIGPVLVQDNGAIGPRFRTPAGSVHVDVALSCVPTMTIHARRALFAGQIPGDGLYDDEPRAGDASADKLAFAQAPALGKTARKLYLKGDLGDGGAALAADLQNVSAPGEPGRLIAVVFNDVDDALSSHEATVLNERTFANASTAFRTAMVAAVEKGWTIVVTADHGHTPYREPDLRLSGTMRNQRFVELDKSGIPPAQTLVFEPTVGIARRLAVAYPLGAHAKQQQVGYHGGVSLEEMCVPLAILGAVAPDGDPFDRPSWWFGRQRLLPIAATNSVVRKRTPVEATEITDAPKRRTSSSVLARCLSALADDPDPKNALILSDLFDKKILSTDQIATAFAIGKGRVRPRLTRILQRLRDAGIDRSFSIDDDGAIVRWDGPTS